MALAASPTHALTLTDRVALRIAIAIETAVARRIDHRAARRSRGVGSTAAAAAAAGRETCAVTAHLLGIRR